MMLILGIEFADHDVPHKIVVSYRYFSG